VRFNPRAPKRRAAGDHSNAQYAAMGLRAGWDAEVRAPAETLRDAAKAWEREQQKDGGWGYGASGSPAKNPTFGSMTAGGLSSLAAIDFAAWLLDQQQSNGSWTGEISETCWAILFLRRATDDFRPPVATGDKK